MSSGTAESMLRRRALTAAVMLYGEFNKDRFPVLFRVFGGFKPESVYDESELIADVVEHLRTLGTAWHSGPTAGDEVELEKFTRFLTEALFKSVKIDFSPDYFATMRDVESLEPALVPASLRRRSERASAKMAKSMAARFDYLLRMVEYVCIQTLTQTSWTATVDGVSRPMGIWDLKQVTSSVDWLSASSDIAKDFEAHKAAAQKIAGEPISKILVPGDWHSLYIAGNDDARAFQQQNPEFFGNSHFGADFATNVPPRYEVIPIHEQYGSYGSTTDMWLNDRITMLCAGFEQSLELATVATEDNDWNGGLYSYTYQENNPRRTIGVVNVSAIPIIHDKTKVYSLIVT